MNPQVVVIQAILILTYIVMPCRAQETSKHKADSLTHVIRDPRIDQLMQAHVRQNKGRVGVEGYRVQIFSGSGNEARQDANDIRKQIISTNPDLPAHLVYQPPNFKVRIGDCRTEVEAIRLKRVLAYDYPQGFVVRDLIKLPRLTIEGQEPGMNMNAPIEIQTQSIDEGQ